MHLSHHCIYKLIQVKIVKWMHLIIHNCVSYLYNLIIQIAKQVEQLCIIN